MALRVVIELAGRPRGKARPRRAPNGTHLYIDEEARKYDAQLRHAATQAMAGRPPTAQPVCMSVELRFPIAPSWSRKKQAAALAGHLRPTVKPDADNALKLADCLNQVVFVDDRQVVEATVRKVYSERPGLTIEVNTTEPPTLPPAATPPSPGAEADLFMGAS